MTEIDIKHSNIYIIRSCFDPWRISLLEMVKYRTILGNSPQCLQLVQCLQWNKIFLLLRKQNAVCRSSGHDNLTFWYLPFALDYCELSSKDRMRLSDAAAYISKCMVVIVIVRRQMHRSLSMSNFLQDYKLPSTQYSKWFTMSKRSSF